MASASPFLPVIELTRGNTVESIHYGAVAVVECSGHLAAHYGDPYGIAFLRSTAKPFQVLPFIEAGGHTHFGITSEEIALMCASHSGTDDHAALAAALQAKGGVHEGDLLCGVHSPYHKPTAEAMLLRGEAPTQNRHNCSGKHTGMLAFARMRGWPLDGYLENDHPVQIAILQTFAEMCGMGVGEVELGVDGCSAPNFAIPFYNAALGLARLADPSGLAAERAGACRTITAAMTAHPAVVAGPGRFDTALMQAANGRMAVKGGAEGYQGIALVPGALGEGSPALGIAIKISDGDPSGRGRAAVALEVLRQLGALGPDEFAALSEFGPDGKVLNWRGLAVGEMRPTFTLERN